MNVLILVFAIAYTTGYVCRGFVTKARMTLVSKDDT